ncbi:26S proteasome regulatory subunit 6A isoform X1 [Tympanuchus pallidicinctus]|uniref:26S proteasome regulatory subunit 6A isoform X1 n=1 Tax=Tympanuchus pallidicinctus TaxID=109042 RepID=UPI002286E21B|nr:26S proteasome regulatory subunit 6A isoform X1 [Tympanuchus pallidicinctus]
MRGGDGAVLWHVWRIYWGEEQPAAGAALLPLLPLKVPANQRDAGLPQLPPAVGETRIRVIADAAGHGNRGASCWGRRGGSSGRPRCHRIGAPLFAHCCTRADRNKRCRRHQPVCRVRAGGRGEGEWRSRWHRPHQDGGGGITQQIWQEHVTGAAAAVFPTADSAREVPRSGAPRAGVAAGTGWGASPLRPSPLPLCCAPRVWRRESRIRREESAARRALAERKMASVWDESEDGVGEEVLKMSTEEIVQRTRLLDSEIKIMKSEVLRVTHELQAMKDKIKENSEKIKVNKTLPYLVSNVIELLDVDPNDQEEDGANIDLDSQRKGKCAVIKTSTRQTYFLPVIGLVDAEKLKPGDLVGVNKDSYLILETLPTEYDSRVKAMEVDERPTEQYSDIGGLDKQIQELVEAIVLPMNHKEKFENLGIQPPKGVLMYGPPGTGKTLLARACAAQTKATFLKLAGPQLVQMFIGDGAKLVRDAFALAKEKAPSIIFIDELDAIGTKRFDSEKAGDREVQRTMLELLNQLDGFQPNTQVKVIAATNRVDILDPALLRSGRLDRKIEFPMPNEEARARIMQIHSRKMNVSPDVNYEELARCTDDFNGAQCKAVCVEAGMIALRRGATELTHEDYMEGILEVQAKKKANLQYYA